MPAENIRAAHSVLTGISARPISKSSLTERLHRPTPTQKRPCADIFGRNWWPQCPLMGWTGCFPREDSLEGLTRSTRRSSPWIPTHQPWPRSASTSARKSSTLWVLALTARLPFAVRSSGWRSWTSATHALSLLRKAAGPYNGLDSEVLASRSYVRFTPTSRYPGGGRVVRLGARSGHSITSSARASNAGGTVRPSALAVLRLITSSYLFGVCTGRSAGFSPLWMRST